MFKVTERLYRTSEGRLVRHGDPAAAFLAFPVGAELSDDEARRFGVTAFYAAPEVPAEKVAAQVPNKMAGPPANKSSSRKEQP